MRSGSYGRAWHERTLVTKGSLLLSLRLGIPRLHTHGMSEGTEPAAIALARAGADFGAVPRPTVIAWVVMLSACA